MKDAKTVFSSVPSAMGNANYVYLTLSARIAEFVRTAQPVSGVTIATTVAPAMTFVSDAVSVQIAQLFAKNVTRIVIIVPKFAISVVYARNVAHQRVNVWTVCALKTLNMSIISALIADNASA